MVKKIPCIQTGISQYNNTKNKKNKANTIRRTRRLCFRHLEHNLLKNKEFQFFKYNR